MYPILSYPTLAYAYFCVVCLRNNGFLFARSDIVCVVIQVVGGRPAGHMAGPQTLEREALMMGPESELGKSQQRASVHT